MKAKLVLLSLGVVSMLYGQTEQGGLRKGNNEGQAKERKAPGKRKGAEGRQKIFDMNQTLSSGAQMNTIAFSALAFYTGSVYSSSFYPPGKVADFFGFQYMRDNDQSESGHNTDYLTKAAWHTMHILNDDQLKILIDLAASQEGLFREYAMKRLLLVDAFHRNLNGDFPTGKTQLDEEQVKSVSAQIYAIDGEITYGRAVAFAKVINSLSPQQVDSLQIMGKQGMQSWSMPERPDVKIPRGLNVWVMSNASELFSWYLRGIEADVYFCPERQGTYFGGFYMKDAPAVGNAGYAIDPQATSGKGSAMLNKILTPDQSEKIKGIYTTVKPALEKIVQIRTEISGELRKAQAGETLDKKRIISLCEAYGVQDGIYIYAMADVFAQVGKTLTPEQLSEMKSLRDLSGYPDKEGRIFIYSKEEEMPVIENTDFLFK
ncbi:MAG: Spy/CpxP family protein refolding chaperone [Bacteroidales bacterium]